MEYRDRQKRYDCETVNRFITSGLVSSKEAYNDTIIRECNRYRHAIDEESK